MKFKSREDAIVKLLSKNANLLPEAASSFCGIAEAEIGTRAAQLKVLREVAAESDRRYLDLVRKVSASAIPPQDREGLHGLADSIDGVVGTLEGSGELLVEFELAELPAAFTRNSRRLYGMRLPAYTIDAMPWTTCTRRGPRRIVACIPWRY